MFDVVADFEPNLRISKPLVSEVKYKIRRQVGFERDFEELYKALNIIIYIFWDDLYVSQKPREKR
jgi:hypothetical protein